MDDDETNEPTKLPTRKKPKPIKKKRKYTANNQKKRKPTVLSTEISAPVAATTHSTRRCSTNTATITSTSSVTDVSAENRTTDLEDLSIAQLRRKVRDLLQLKGKYSSIILCLKNEVEQLKVDISMGKKDLHNVVSQHSIQILEKDSRIRAIINLNAEEMSKKDLAMKELSKKLQAEKNRIW